MKAATCILCLAVILAAFPGAAPAQSVISAKSGLINYTDGTVLLDGKEIRTKIGNFPQMKPNQELRTEDGRAEILLSPGVSSPGLGDGSLIYASNGVVLRAAENTALRLLSDKLTDTRLELTAGSIIVECADNMKLAPVTLAYKDATVTLSKKGLYRLDAEPAQLRVYEGEASVDIAKQTQTVKTARLLALNGVSVPEKFDNRAGDALYRWARRRAEQLAMANASSARSLRSEGLTTNSLVYNPYFGLYTFVPGAGTYNSFWGYSYWSPRTVVAIYNPPAIPAAGGGYNNGYNNTGSYASAPATSVGTSSVAASSPAPTTSTSSSSVAVGQGSSSSGGSSRR